MINNERDLGWAKERLRLDAWQLELQSYVLQLRSAYENQDYAAKRRCLAWFLANGVDSVAGY